VDQLKPVLSRLGHMSTVGDYGAFIANRQGLKDLAETLDVVLNKCEDEDVQRGIGQLEFR